MTQPQDDPSGKTPSSPDVEPDGRGNAGRTPDAADQAEGDDNDDEA